MPSRWECVTVILCSACSLPLASTAFDSGSGQEQADWAEVSNCFNSSSTVFHLGASYSSSLHRGAPRRRSAKLWCGSCVCGSLVWSHARSRRCWTVQSKTSHRLYLLFKKCIHVFIIKWCQALHHLIKVLFYNLRLIFACVIKRCTLWSGNMSRS